MVRSGEVADRWVVAGAAATAAGALVARSLPIWVPVVVGAVALVRRRPAVWCLLLFLVADLLAVRSLEGLTAPPDAPFDGVVILVTDPEPTTGGRLRFEASTPHGRLLSEVRSPHAIEAIRSALAGDRLHVRGTTGTLWRTTDWTRSRHLSGTLLVEVVVAKEPGGAHHAAANGYRRLLDRGAASLDPTQRSLLAGLVLGDDRAQPPQLTADFRASGLTHLLAVSGENVGTLEIWFRPVQAVIYTRVSQDRARGRSVAEQEADARAMCEREGWTVAEVVTDSVGASRRSKGTRTGWQRTTDLLEAGDVDVLVTWEASRAQRDLVAYGELRDLCARTGTLWAYSGRIHDLSEGHDRFTTGLDALLAEREAEDTRTRVLRAVRANAAAGRPHGRRLFGYRRTYDPDSGHLVGQEPDPLEAPVVRRIFADYLSGIGSRTIARNLNAEEITTGTGARWQDSQVWRVLQNPAYAARRVHRGEVVGPADWPALVSENTFDAAQARRQAAQTGRHRQSREARLLTAVARCGLCGGKMAVGHDRNHRKVYQCRTHFHISRDEVMVDEYVSAAIVARIDDADVDLSPTDSDEVLAMRVEVDDLRKRLAEATAEFTAGRLSAGTLGVVETDLTGQIDLIERRIRRCLLPINIEPPTGDAATWWADLGRERRREYAGAFIAAVTIGPTRRGSRTFDPDAITIDWR